MPKPCTKRIVDLNDLCTQEIVTELLDRIKNTNGVEFVELEDLYDLYNYVKQELKDRGI